MTQILEVTQYLEQLAPLALQESYDNCGLLIGDAQWNLQGVLITLDVTEAVVDEAIAQGCNLIVAHHPLIFKGIKKLSPSSYVERTIIKAIKNDIAIYAIHTNLDNVWDGVNKKIADKLELKNTQILQTGNDNFSKLTFFVPQTHTEIVLAAVHSAGAGVVGNYSSCAFSTAGMGQFCANDGAAPFVGTINQVEKVVEDKVEVVLPTHLQNQVLKILIGNHPYEEVAYYVVPLANPHPNIGAGRIGTLTQPMMPLDFIAYMKEKLCVSLVRCSPLPDRLISKVALCGGSGSFLFATARKAKADIYISSDFKYHEFFDADAHTMIADINHYEAEYFTKELLFEHLNKKFANIALVLSKINTNPISYL